MLLFQHQNKVGNHYLQVAMFRWIHCKDQGVQPAQFGATHVLVQVWYCLSSGVFPVAEPVFGGVARFLAVFGGFWLLDALPCRKFNISRLTRFKVTYRATKEREALTLVTGEARGQGFF